MVVTLTVFLQLASPANNKYVNGRHVKTPINIKEQDHIERSHAGPEEYVSSVGILPFTQRIERQRRGYHCIDGSNGARQGLCKR